MVRTLLLVLALVFLLLIAVVFGLSNPGDMELDLAFGEYKVKTAWAFAAALGGGWLLGVLGVLAYVIKLWAERRSLRKQIRVANTELNNLRSLPIQDAG